VDAQPTFYVVAMTRAQALLIVVGNPIVLSLDALVCRSCLNYVHTKGGCREIGEPVNIKENDYDAKYRAKAGATDNRIPKSGVVRS
jgi:helicase MOV-10